MVFFAFLIAATLFLAYANGANDNFKGVATLFGSRTTNYKTALAWATATTFAGSITSVFLANTLVKNFSGKGLVPDAIANTSQFHLAVAIGAGLTVILATVFGFPISTTHGLTGALVGAGLVAVGTQVNLAFLQKSFVMPLLFSPIVAIGCGAVCYLIFHAGRKRLDVKTESCVCIGEVASPVAAIAGDVPIVQTAAITTELTLDSVENCAQRYIGRVWGIRTQSLVDGLHFLSAGVVSFARGLNDTPKIVSLILVGEAISLRGSAFAVGLAMAIGGVLNARKVAETMSRKISTMNVGQGISANLVTGALVVAASRYGLPVSTTHVSVGAIFGVGLIAKTAHPQVFYQILLSWVLTLPIAALLSIMTYSILQR